VPDVSDGVRFYQEALNLKQSGPSRPDKAVLGADNGCQLELLQSGEANGAAALSPLVTVAVSNLPTAVRNINRKGGKTGESSTAQSKQA
jgi:hypothetical protein